MYATFAWKFSFAMIDTRESSGSALYLGGMETESAQRQKMARRRKWQDAGLLL